MIPLSTRMRPDKLEDFVGQTHFFYKGSLLYNAIENRTFDSAIFFGPSGTGKTTLARIVASQMDGNFQEINASVTGLKELREIIEDAKTRAFGLQKETTYLYVDEFHRWNKLQQDSLLKALEEGVLRFIGSTTENPYFSVNNSILSRVGNIYEFEKLSAKDVERILKKALEDDVRGLGRFEIRFESDTLEMIASMSSGDARRGLDALSFIAENLKDDRCVTEQIVLEAMQRKTVYFNKEEDRYDLLSALQKSIRGSDPDAAIHYLARLLQSTDDINMVGRRLMVIASEDVGMAYPHAISIVTSCVQAALMVGLPEAKIILSHGVILMASSPKSNSAYMAYSRAKADLEDLVEIDMPPHLKDSHYSGAKDRGHGIGYLYPHDHGGYVKQDYLPKKLLGKQYYQPTDNGNEVTFKRYLDSLNGDKTGDK